MTAAAPSGVVTFLFTDIEGSTRRWEADAAAMRAALLAVARRPGSWFPQPARLTAAPLNSPVLQTRLVSQTQPQPTTQALPTTQMQQAVTNPANTAAGEVGQQSTLSPTLSTNVSASGSGSSQPVSTPIDTASAKKVTSSSTGNGSGASARGNNAVADVENGTGSVSAHLPKSTSTSSTSSQATSGSSGSAASHKKS